MTPQENYYNIVKISSCTPLCIYKDIQELYNCIKKVDCRYPLYGDGRLYADGESAETVWNGVVSRLENVATIGEINPDALVDTGLDFNALECAMLSAFIKKYGSESVKENLEHVFVDSTYFEMAKALTRALYAFAPALDKKSVKYCAAYLRKHMEELEDKVSE